MKQHHETEEIYMSIDEFIWPSKWLLTLAGFWPVDANANSAVRYFSHCRVVFSIVLTATVVLPQLAEILDKWGDLRVLTEVGSLVLPMALALFKQLCLVARRAQFEQTYRQMRNLWTMRRDFHDSMSLESCAWQAKFATVLFYATGCLTYAIYVVTPIYAWELNARRSNGSHYERHLLLGSRYWFDPSPSPIFEMVYAHQALGFYMAGNCVVGIDGSMVMMIMQVVGQFKIIARKLESIGAALRDGARSTRIADPWIVIRQCIKHHIRMLRIAKEMDSLLGPMVLAQILLAALEICLNEYAVISGTGHGVDTIKYTFLLILAIVQLVIYCLPGEILIQASLGLASTVCNEVPWFMLTYEQQRDLCMIVVRSQRQSQITALGLQVMTMRKLTEVFQAAGSYMALLRSLKDKQQRHL